MCPQLGDEMTPKSALPFRTIKAKFFVKFSNVVVKCSFSAKTVTVTELEPGYIDHLQTL